MNIHVDLTAFLLLAVALIHFAGWLAFESTIVVLLTVGLPYGGPP